ncbi:hypothetical protein PENSPDRAFT_576804 [Peniophora sp. CONT]|nr:hypothetical protein PENSPDRAFT_576804 [Peniophora sp. CONT]
MAASKVSFTVRRPEPVSRSESSGGEDSDGFLRPPVPRHLRPERANSKPGSPLRQEDVSRYVDSSEEEDEERDELVTEFDKFGAKRCVLHEDKNSKGPLIIPALQNKDWRAMAKARRQGSERYVPQSASAGTGADGSVGGLGTRDTINSGPEKVGLEVRARVKSEEGEDQEMTPAAAAEEVKVEEETEDQRALRALLSGDTGAQDIAVIPLRASEEDAYKQDVDELPEEATLEDYERVPVEQFGAALLRGMGWQEGQAASRKSRKGPIEPYLPTARPALLGLGAKEQEVLDDGSQKNKRSTRPERRYVPVIQKERESGTSSREESRSRQRSPEPDRRKERREKDDGRSSDRGRDGRDRDDRYTDRRDSERRGDRDSRKDYDRGSRRDYGYDDRRDHDRRRDDRERERSPRRDYSRRSDKYR